MRLESLLGDDLSSFQDDLTSVQDDDLTSIQDDEDNDEVLRIRLAGIIAARQRKYLHCKYVAQIQVSYQIAC